MFHFPSGEDDITATIAAVTSRLTRNLKNNNTNKKSCFKILRRAEHLQVRSPFSPFGFYLCSGEDDVSGEPEL